MFNCSVFNGNKLPMSFTDNENLRYYKQYKLGDMNARDMLIRHNLRLVFSIIKERKYDKLGYDIEDIMSIGVEGLIKGIDTYDEEVNNKMSVYVSKYIKFEILNYLRKENYYKKKGYSFVSVDDIAKESDGDFICNGDVIRIEYESVEDIVIDRIMEIYYREMIIKMIDMLSDRDKEIFMLTYGFVDGKVYKQEEIATKIGVSRGVVSMVIIRNLRKMKDRLMFEEKNNILCRKKIIS